MRLRALRRRFLLCLLLACGMGAAAAQTAPLGGRWIALGPEGGDVRSLAFDPHDPNRIFLGTSAGELYLSTDAGASWMHYAHLGEGYDYVVDHIVVDPDDSQTVFVAGWSIENKGGDIFRSRDGGRTWQALPGMHGKSVRSFAIFERNPRMMFAGALDGVFRSHDGGDTWERISPAHHAEIKNIESLAVDPRSPYVIYAGTWHLPWKTVDGGRTWNPMKQGIVDDSDVFSIIIDRQKPWVIYLSACSGIYRSENFGARFRKVHGIPFSARRTRVLRQDPVNPAVIYAGTTEGLWKTQDGGKTWQRTTASKVIVNDVMVDPRRPSHVLLATDRSGVLLSEDGGQSLKASNHGFSHRQVSAVLADRRIPATLYAGVINDKEFGGVFVTYDAGAHWRQMNAGLAGHDIFSLAQSEDGDLLAGTHRGIFVYDHKLAHWRGANTVATDKLKRAAERPAKGKRRKTTTRRDAMKSELTARVVRVAVAGGRWYAATSSGIYSSRDHGRGWKGGPVNGEQNFLSLDAAGEQVLASTPSALVHSRDGGGTWTTVVLPAFVTTLSSVMLSPEAMWIVTQSGVFSSPDNGATWEHVLVGSPAQNLTAIDYDRSAQRVLGVASTGEVYSTSDGRSWSRASAPGYMIRSVTAAGGRLLGITPFSGIVAQPEMETQNLRGTASGGGPAR